MGDTRRMWGELKETLDAINNELKKSARVQEGLKAELTHLRIHLDKQAEAMVAIGKRLTFIEEYVTSTEKYNRVVQNRHEEQLKKLRDSDAPHQ